MNSFANTTRDRTYLSGERKSAGHRPRSGYDMRRSNATQITLQAMANGYLVNHRNQYAQPSKQQDRSTVQRNKLKKEFKNPTSDFSDVSGTGIFATNQVTKHSEIAKLAKALDNHLYETGDIEQQIVILTGCHGDQLGNLIYNEDNFLDEDKVLVDDDEIPFVEKIVNMQGLSREEQINAMTDSEDKVLILSWCYSAASYKNRKHYEITK